MRVHLIAIALAALSAAVAGETTFLRPGYHADIAADAAGRFVAFTAPTGVDGMRWSAYLRDRSTGADEDLAARLGGPADRACSGVSISGDARWVVLSDQYGVHLLDRVAGTARELSAGMPRGDVGGRWFSYAVDRCAVSDDGRRVLFTQFATERLAPAGDATYHLWDRDGGIVAFRRYPLGRFNADRDASISRDGTICVFEDVGDPGVQVYVVATGAVEDVTRDASGRVIGGCYGPSVSADGRYVAFHSARADAHPDAPLGGVFVKDRLLGGVELAYVYTAISGTPYELDGFTAMDRLGRFVVFGTVLPHGNATVMRWDRNLAATALVARVASGAPSSDWIGDAAITGDGATVYISAADVAPSSGQGLYAVRFADGATTPYARVNFQPAGATTPSGYLPDSGAVFGLRAGGFRYGWSAANASGRDRGDPRSPDQRYDTLLHMRAPTWEIALPDGLYDVQVTCGDPTFPDSVIDLTIEGRPFLSGALTSQRRWIGGHRRVSIRDGRLTLRAGPTARNAKICFVDIHRVAGVDLAFAATVNFQPASTPIPHGCAADVGLVFAPRGNGLAYGWNAPNPTTRDRGAVPDQRYDTLIHTQRPENPDAVWEIAVPSGVYEVHVAAGDPLWLDSVYDLMVEGVGVLAGEPTSESPWLEGWRDVEVRDGRMTLRNGSSARNAKLSYIDLISLPTGPG
ncbi:MAG TPA: hypothetical protein VEL07_12740 [Planctomycetota bacterium]|nr:hypothetical protein [Planctomycetota bacterium]